MDLHVPEMDGIEADVKANYKHDNIVREANSYDSIFLNANSRCRD